MKNIILSLIFIVVVMVAAAVGIKSFLLQRKREGTNYYTRITSLSESREESDYVYRVNGYDKNGEIIKLEFYGMDEQPIKKGSYLRITYGTVSDGSKDVKRWEEVKKSEVPEKALEKIEKTK